MMIIQMILGLVIGFVNSLTFKYEMWPIKWLLFVQCIQMSLSNFNQYREGTDQQIAKDNRFFVNYMGLNILVAVFSVMFNIFNVVLISFIHQHKLSRYIQITIAMSFNCLTIIFTNFTLEDISETAIVTIIVSVVYTAIIVPSFLWISDAISQEALDEASEAGIMRMQFKSMFDSLQEGIIVY